MIHNIYESFAEYNNQKLIQLIKTLGYNVLDYRPTENNPYSQDAVLDIIEKNSSITSDNDVPIIFIRSFLRVLFHFGHTLVSRSKEGSFNGVT